VGEKRVYLDEEMDTMRNGAGEGKAKSWLMNSLPTSPTPTTATQTPLPVTLDDIAEAAVRYVFRVVCGVDEKEGLQGLGSRFREMNVERIGPNFLGILFHRYNGPDCM